MRTGHALAALLILLAAAGALFAAGLPGGFLLDDFPNLSGLERARDGAVYGGIYLSEGATGFPGRPLSYLTFFLQAKSWPGDPLAFKIVNIALHLVNGALIYLMTQAMLGLAGRRDATVLAIVAAALWLIHPIQISTVLYVVQRMTELSALFCLCGVLAYLKGRALAAAGRIKPGYAWMSAAVALATPLAVLAKENGALLPVYIAAIEFTLLAGVARPARWKLWAAVFLAFPPLALAAYIAFFAWPDVGRLYTQAIILWEYLGKIVLPRPRAFGIYYDDYAAGVSQWSAFAMAAASAAWCAALALALAWRRKRRFLSFAVLWFLAGHLLESTVLPLELYFEHRNYLPLFGPALGLAWGAKQLWDAASAPRTRHVYAALGLSGALLLAGVTWIEARTWGDPLHQVVVWANERPASPRAQYALGMQYLFAGRYAEAGEVLARGRAMAPHETYFGMAHLLIGCLTDDVPIPETRAMASDFARFPMRPVITNLLENLVLQLEHRTCRRVRADDALELTQALLANPEVSGQYRWVALYTKGRVLALQGELDPAVRALEAADEILPNLGVLHLQVTWLASAALYDDALQFIEKGRGDPRWRPWQRALYAGFFDAWERQVREAAHGKGVAVREGA